MSKDFENNKQKNNKLVGIGLASLLILLAFFSGVELGRGTFGGSPQEASIFSLFRPATTPDEGVSLTEFWRVWNLMEDKFVSGTSTTPGNEDLIRGAIAGMVKSYGDPYSVYLPPEEASAFEEEISGNFSGVGMEVGIRNQLITVISPLPDSPAEKAGLLAGDVIVKINDSATDNLGLDQAVKMIRGEKGTEVTLTIYREGESEFLTKAIVRDVITIPTLETEVVDGTFIIRLYSFNALSQAKMHEAMEQFIREGHSKLVLDLRGNPGGFLESAVAIAGYFLEPGQVIVRENFGEAREEKVYRSQGKLPFDFNKDNFVILVNEGSASASEILAGALSEHGVATTIGETTFGKGSVQELVELPDNSSLKVTIARWLTPEGVSFSEGGLEPAVKVTRTPQQAVAGEDPQREAALKWLKGEREIGEKLGMKPWEGEM